jgi:serine/threonine protein kinase
MDPFDPVVTEATFMKFLEPLNICPKVLHISGTTTVGNDMGKVQQTTCDKDDGSGQYDGPIRYMIMEKVGIDLYDLMIGSPNNRIPFREAIQYGIKMMELIQKLHSKNIIHGDAHLGNFATRLNDINSLLLIDFGRARYVGPKEIADARYRTDFCTNEEIFHNFNGKWEMMSCKPAFRDDVYRAVEMTAVIMHGPYHFDYLTKLSKIDPNRYKEIKNTGNLFNLPQLTYKSTDGDVQEFHELSVKGVSGITEEQALDLIQIRLDRISMEAVHEDFLNPYHRPDYEAIINQFKSILNILQAYYQE